MREQRPGGLGAVFLVEECVVVLGRVERRIQVNEVNGLVLQIPRQDVKVVAVIDRAHVCECSPVAVENQ